MLDFMKKERYDYADLVQLVALLRGDGGCEWDGAQTHRSIRRNFLEEAYEACEGIDRDDPAIMREEFGDVLLQVIFHADIECGRGRFTMQDVCDGVCKKLVFRHPHLFGDADAPQDWEELKKREKGAATQFQLMEDVAASLPALIRSEKLWEKARKGGFSPASPAEALALAEGRLTALKSAAASGGDTNARLGELLFSVVGAAVSLNADAETALHDACRDFIAQYTALEQNKNVTHEQLLALWNEQETQQA